MKKILPKNRERKKIAELARVYNARGYQVFVDIPKYKSPSPIDGIKPDLIVKKGDETIIIEVKTSESLRKRKDIVANLARYAREVPGARFDLVITNPKPQSSVQVKVKAFQEALGAIQKGLLTDIKEAIKYDRMDLAVILASRLLEGLLVRTAVNKGVYIPPKERTLRALASKLANEDIVSRSVLKFASKLQKQRNAIVHGKAIISNKDVIDMYQKLEKLSKLW